MHAYLTVFHSATRSSSLPQQYISATHEIYLGPKSKAHDYSSVSPSLTFSSRHTDPLATGATKGVSSAAAALPSAFKDELKPERTPLMSSAKFRRTEAWLENTHVT